MNRHWLRVIGTLNAAIWFGIALCLLLAVTSVEPHVAVYALSVYCLASSALITGAYFTGPES